MHYYNFCLEGLCKSLNEVICGNSKIKQYDESHKPFRVARAFKSVAFMKHSMTVEMYNSL